ncbi:hypothetical protein OA253_00580 [Alphaproteobacteria bacterium]|nr:hypothetical protein [Alphaproteobacteria bacterium]
MLKSEENKFDKLEEELLNIEKFAKNLDLNSKDEFSMVLTKIVPDDQNVTKNNGNIKIINQLNNIKLSLNKQIKEIDEIIKNFDK